MHCHEKKIAMDVKSIVRTGREVETHCRSSFRYFTLFNNLSKPVKKVCVTLYIFMWDISISTQTTYNRHTEMRRLLIRNVGVMQRGESMKVAIRRMDLIITFLTHDRELK